MRQKSSLKVSLGQKQFLISDAEHILPHTAEPLAPYRGFGLEGLPAITINAAGKGFVIYVSFTSTEDAFFDTLFTTLAARFHIQPLLDAPAGVDVVSRTHAGTEFLFAINNTLSPVRIPLPSPTKELLTNQQLTTLEIKPLDLAILEAPTGRLSWGC